MNELSHPTPSDAPPSLDEWRRLYAAAQRIKALEPWEWMTELDTFGIELPDTGELGFVSVMGALGEHFAIAVYRGTRAVFQLLEVQDAGPAAQPEMIIEIPQVQVMFEDREMVTKEDRVVMKQLGLKFRGRNAWPIFRSFEPGFVPWYLTAAEARLLTLGLEQLPAMAERVKDDPDLLYPGGDDAFLMLRPQAEGEHVTWREEVLELEEPETIPIVIMVNSLELADLKSRKRSRTVLEVDLFWVPTGVDEGDRPYYPYSLIVVEDKQGFIVGQDLLRPSPTFETMLGMVAQSLVTQLGNLPDLPREIRVSSVRLAQLIAPVMGELRIKVNEVEYLPHAEMVKQGMLAALGYSPPGGLLSVLDKLDFND